MDVQLIGKKASFMMRIGPFEIALIFAVAVAVIGTKNLPSFGKKAGEAVRDFKVNSKDITDAVKVVKDEIDDVKEVLTLDLKNEENHG